MRLTKECQKCNKFSHCNNNDLFCEKFITQELQTAKEEIIRLQSNDYFYVELDKKNELLTQQLQTSKEENEQTYQTLFEQVQSCFEYPDLEEDLSIGELLTLNQVT